MKKIFSYILIALIAANLFAPLSMSVDQNRGIKILSNRAEAGGGGFIINQLKRTDSALTFKITIIREKTDNHIAAWGLRDKPGGEAGGGTLMERKEFNPADGAVDYPKLDGWAQSDFTFTTTNPLTPNTTYYLAVGLQNGTSSGGFAISKDIAISTTPTGIVDDVTKQIGSADTTDGFMPSCGIGDTWFTDGTIMGCLAQIIYYAVFQPTSFLFGLAGGFFDNTFAYSVNSEAYRNPFVVQGWGIVRDFVNMFFIFVLLWVAFSTILSVHGFKTKEMIVNVILIGIFINFSLFATQVIIDTSNILARVFYNSDAVKLKDKNGAAIALKPGEPIPLSAAIVTKVEPQRLIIEGTKNVGIIDKVNGNETATADQKNTNLGVGTFILITLLAIGVNIVGIIVFATVGLIFIARVIGLWIAMVLAPLAFFTYTVPAMKDIEMIGWGKWWMDTLKLAFLAPIFMFFMYLILKFLSVMTIVKTSGLGGVGFVLTIIVPFAFIMILLMRAKSIAVKFSGSIGATVTKAVTVGGGLALGGAALGGAALGRKFIGGTVAKASRGDTATQKYEEGRATGFTAVRGFVGSKLGLGRVYGRRDPNTGMISSGLGGKLNKTQQKVGEVDHARHEMDAIKEKAGLKGVDNSKLSGVNQKKLEETYAKEKRGEVETKLRKEVVTQDPNTGAGVVGEDGYKAANRNRVARTVTNNPNARANGDIDASGDLTDAGKKKVENQLNVDFNAVLKTATDQKLSDDYQHHQGLANEKVNPFERIAASSNTGSYDPRNLTETKADKREGLLTRMSAGLIAGIAMGVRMGLRTGGINSGSAQKDFLKDLGNTLETALKNAKIEVKTSGGGHSSAPKADHGGGGAHH